MVIARIFRVHNVGRIGTEVRTEVRDCSVRGRFHNNVRTGASKRRFGRVGFAGREQRMNERHDAGKNCAPVRGLPRPLIGKGFLTGKRFADLAQEHALSTSRVRQIIEKADRLVGGGILTEAEPSKASPRSDFMVAYPYVWNLAEMHRLDSVTPHHFFKELERAGSLERLVDKMKRLPSRARTNT